MTNATVMDMEIPRRRESSIPRMPTWPTIAALLLSIMMPVCGWLISLSNRVAVLESEVRHMATSEQVAAQTQKLDDFEGEYRRDQINLSVSIARTSK